MVKFSETVVATDALRTLQKVVKVLSEGYSQMITLREIVKITRKACDSKKGFFIPADKMVPNAEAEFWILKNDEVIKALQDYFTKTSIALYLETPNELHSTIKLKQPLDGFKPAILIPIHHGPNLLGLLYFEEPQNFAEGYRDLYHIIAKITTWFVIQSEQKGGSASYFVDLNQYPKALDKTAQSDMAMRRSFIQKRYANIISISPQMYKIIREIDKLGMADSTVLIEGESGTGKELVATTVHFNSMRKDKPFVPVNCSAIPFELCESEFFGHVKGSFTGAIADQQGLFENANGGTLFLDEIGDLPLTMQAKLLRALEEKEIRPVGSEKTVKVDVRLISATNRNLKEMIAQNQFRQDLYYRINTFNLEIPPLRHRKEDIPPLVNHFLKQISTKMGIPTKQVSRDAVRKLIDYDWPGNIRELYNTLERAALLAHETIKPDHLSMQTERLSDQGILLSKMPTNMPISKIFEEIEKTMIEDAIKVFSGNKQRIAKRLGIDRKTLYRKMKQYNLLTKEESK